jgi:hypothetical protein
LIKKTPEPPYVFERSNLEGKAFLSDGYEELRAYVISPVKTPSRPIGLDLWLKRGFMSWAAVMQRREPQSSANTSTRPGNVDISDGLVTSLANILAEWSDKNVRQQN